MGEEDDRGGIAAESSGQRLTRAGRFEQGPLPEHATPVCREGEAMCNQKDAERYFDGAVETVNARDWAGYGAFFAEDVAMRFPGAVDGSVSGRAARVRFVEGIMRAFPDGGSQGSASSA